MIIMIDDSFADSREKVSIRVKGYGQIIPGKSE